MKETCGDCRHPKLRVEDGKHVSFCPKKDKKIYLTQEACTDDASLKIARPYAKKIWGTATKIDKGVHQNEERTS
jgi:hypothetical protein